VLDVLEPTIHDCLPSNSIELDDFFHDQEKVPGLPITAFEPLLNWDGILRVQTHFCGVQVEVKIQYALLERNQLLSISEVAEWKHLSLGASPERPGLSCLEFLIHFIVIEVYRAVVSLAPCLFHIVWLLVHPQVLWGYSPNRAGIFLPRIKGILDQVEVSVPRLTCLYILCVEVLKVQEFPSSVRIVLDEVKAGERESSIRSLLTDVAIEDTKELLSLEEDLRFEGEVT
jgi:hypothetical protein